VNCTLKRRQKRGTSSPSDHYEITSSPSDHYEIEREARTGTHRCCCLESVATFQNKEIAADSFPVQRADTTARTMMQFIGVVSSGDRPHNATCNTLNTAQQQEAIRCTLLMTAVLKKA
jgi:hypothetical protein